MTAVTRRRDAVYPATLVGIPPQEDAYIAKATEKIFLAPIRLAVQPEVKELTMPVFGTAHNLAVVSIDRRYRGQAHKVAQGLWGAGQMMFNKYLVITGEDCDVHDPDRLAALLRRAEFPRDLIVSEGVYDVLDHATVTSGFGGKLAFDLTEIDPSAPAEAVRVPERFELTPGLVEAGDIEKNKMRGDLGISYDVDVLRLIDVFRGLGFYVGSVVHHPVRRPDRQRTPFMKRLSTLGVKQLLSTIPSPAIPPTWRTSSATRAWARTTTSRPRRSLIVVTAPGPGSGKMATCLSQLYHEHKRGIRAGYAKFETFPIWNLPLKHPVNLAYEAATADLNDVNMIDPFHLEAYGKTTVNYNRDVEIFPVLAAMFRMIQGECPYQVPHGHGREHGGLLLSWMTRCARRPAGWRSCAGTTPPVRGTGQGAGRRVRGAEAGAGDAAGRRDAGHLPGGGGFAGKGGGHRQTGRRHGACRTAAW